MKDLEKNEIICSAQAVKYHDIEYSDDFVTITQNRTRRRVPNGYYFDDTGTHIYVSPYYSGIFQHKNKYRKFILNKETKEWRDFQAVIIEKHIPEKIEHKKNNTIERLKK